MLILLTNNRQSTKNKASSNQKIQENSVHRNLIRTAMNYEDGDVAGRATMLLIIFSAVTAATAIPNAITTSPTSPLKPNNNYMDFRNGAPTSRVPFKMPVKTSE